MGGWKTRAYVASHVKYPKKAIKKGREGKVLIRFAIGTDGRLFNFQIKKDEIGYGAAESVVKALKELPNFEPTQVNGEPVHVFYTFRVDFRLPK